MEPKKILVVDDEPSVRELISDALTLSGFQVATAVDGYEAAGYLKTQAVDLVVTDINMPRTSGYELVEAMRSRGDETPVIFLTARNEKPDISKGFKIGGDDYISKPFGLEELILRITAILKRSAKTTVNSVLLCGPIALDTEKHTVTLFDEFVNLSPTEFRLLTYLVENKNKVISKHSLLDVVWDLGFAENTSVVDTFISYLRKKLHKGGFTGITTVRGVGFKISDRA
jgi:two-component system OmpR family response regulator